jgi:predicted DNA-binding transcriptional regulator AlpA
VSYEHPEEERDQLLTITQIIQRFGVSRQTLHRWRSRGLFPEPESPAGSTPFRWRESRVAAFIAANPKRPGARTDLARKTEDTGEAPAGDDDGARSAK